MRGRAWPCVTVVGNTTAAVFEAYRVERALARALRPGQVALDNLGAHKGEWVQKLMEERGCEPLFLAPCSPALNPSQEALSKAKGLLGE